MMNMLFKVCHSENIQWRVGDLVLCLLTLNLFYQNFMFYGLSSFANDWVAAKGPEEILFVFGGTSIFLCLLGLQVCVCGKRLRSQWARHDLFVTLNMETTGPVQELG